MAEPDNAQVIRLREELSRLRGLVAGVRGSVVAGVDGLLFFQEGATGQDANDLAALAAAAYGIGRQAGRVMGHGMHHDTTIHNNGGYFVVYSISDSALLAMVCEAGINVARLHLEFRGCLPKIAQSLRDSMEILAYQRPRF